MHDTTKNKCLNDLNHNQRIDSMFLLDYYSVKDKMTKHQSFPFFLINKIIEDHFSIKIVKIQKISKCKSRKELKEKKVQHLNRHPHKISFLKYNMY